MKARMFILDQGISNLHPSAVFFSAVAWGGSNDLTQALFPRFMEHLRSLALSCLPLLTDWLVCKMTLCVYFSCSFITSCCSLQNSGALKRLCLHTEPGHTLKPVLFLTWRHFSITVFLVFLQIFGRKWGGVGLGELN